MTGYYMELGEMDLMSVDRNTLYLREFEIKCSRWDFKREFELKKAKHEAISSKAKGVPNRFGFVCPDGMIKKEEIPEYSGLYYVLEDDTIKKIKLPPLLHRRKINQQFMVNTLSKLNARIHSNIISRF